jgi:hypothetical protein
MFKLKAFLIAIILFCILASTSMAFSNIKHPKSIILSLIDLPKYVNHKTYFELETEVVKIHKNCRTSSDAITSGFKCCKYGKEAYFKCYLEAEDWSSGNVIWTCNQFACVDNLFV